MPDWNLCDLLESRKDVSELEQALVVEFPSKGKLVMQSLGVIQRYLPLQLALNLRLKLS